MLVHRPHILFVCGRNHWRSPTAAKVYEDDPRIEVRSAGVSKQSPHRISMRDLEWADLVLVMERKHAARIREEFRSLPGIPRLESMDIPDEYGYMDAELVQLVTEAAEPHIAAIVDPHP